MFLQTKSPTSIFVKNEVFVAMFILLLQLLIFYPVSIDATHYLIVQQNQRHASNDQNGNATRSVVARSPTECVLKCNINNKKKGLAPGDSKPFYSENNECFCLVNDQQNIVSEFSKQETEITGSLLTKVRSKIAINKRR